MPKIVRMKIEINVFILLLIMQSYIRLRQLVNVYALNPIIEFAQEKFLFSYVIFGIIFYVWIWICKNNPKLQKGIHTDILHYYKSKYHK